MQMLKAIADTESKRIRSDTGTSAAQSASLVAQSTANDIMMSSVAHSSFPTTPAVSFSVRVENSAHLHTCTMHT